MKSRRHQMSPEIPQLLPITLENPSAKELKDEITRLISQHAILRPDPHTKHESISFDGAHGALIDQLVEATIARLRESYPAEKAGAASAKWMAEKIAAERNMASIRRELDGVREELRRREAVLSSDFQKLTTSEAQDLYRLTENQTPENPVEPKTVENPVPENTSQDEMNSTGEIPSPRGSK